MNRFFGGSNSPRGVFFGSWCARTAALTALAALWIVTPGWAQRFKQIAPRIPEREAQSMRRSVQSAVKDSASLGTNAQTVTDYFTKYYFPKMTSYDPEDLAELGDMRENLFRYYIRVSGNAETLATLNTLALKVATALAQGNYYPAVRYNAALILGNLDQQLASGGRSNPTPPIPLPAATAALLGLLEQDDFEGVKVHPSVRLGALVGLERHARFGIAPEHAQRVTKAALDVIAQAEPPEEVTQDAQDWMRCRAASVLANQFREKPNVEFQNTLNAMVTNEELDLDNRCYIAGLMKPVKYEQADGIDPKPVVAALAKLSQDVLKEEAKLARDYQKEILGDTGLGSRDLFRGRSYGRGDAEEPKYERRQMLSRLKAIYDAGTSLNAGVPEEMKTQMQALLDAMKPARDAARDKDAIDLDVAEKVIQAAQDVSQVINSWSQDAAPAEADEADLSSATF